MKTATATWTAAVALPAALGLLKAHQSLDQFDDHGHCLFRACQSSQHVLGRIMNTHLLVTADGKWRDKATARYAAL